MLQIKFFIILYFLIERFTFRHVQKIKMNIASFRAFYYQIIFLIKNLIIMSNEGKSLSEILPASEKKNYNKYSDILKEPLAGIQDKRNVVSSALEEEEE